MKLISFLLVVTMTFASVPAWAAPANDGVQVKQNLKDRVVRGAQEAWDRVAVPVGEHVSSFWEYAKGRFSAVLGPMGKVIDEKLGGVFTKMKFSWQSRMKKLSSTGAGKGITKGAAQASKLAKGIGEKIRPSAADDKQVVIRLKNGSAISCRLISETPNQVVVEWEGGQVTFGRNEILGIDRKKSLGGDGIQIAEVVKKEAWAYHNNPVFRMTNGQIIDGALKNFDGKALTVAEDLGSGAFIDHEIPLQKLETLLFKQIENPESAKAEEKLRGLFPRMRVYREGMITLITDSEGASLKTLKQTIHNQIMELYLKFHGLLKGREPMYQHMVVVFDDFDEYVQYALTDGVPAWACPGYFLPTEKTLFMINLFGDRFSGIMYEAVSGTRDIVNQQADMLKERAGERYEAQIDGIAHDLKSKLENAFAYLKGIAIDETLMTLRHELTHEFLHDWGVQSIIVSKLKGKSTEELDKKRKELLEEQSIEKKKQIIIDILGVRKKDSPKVDDFEAANSWFVEGVAEYASTTGIGRPNTARLYKVKEAKRTNSLLPVEHLTVYKMGSFLGLASDAALSMYAQSWSFVDFLMTKHRTGFIKYLQRMASERPAEGDDLKWLLESLGMELRAIESEWHAYIDLQEDVKDPEIEMWFRVREILKL